MASMGALSIVDSMGRNCPLPVLDLAKAIGQVDVGDELVVLADDPGAKVDIPVWCRMKRQELVDVGETEGGWSFTVRRVR